MCWTFFQILSNAETECWSTGYQSGTALYDCNFLDRKIKLQIYKILKFHDFLGNIFSANGNMFCADFQ